jgi:hypothetical protein
MPDGSAVSLHDVAQAVHSGPEALGGDQEYEDFNTDARIAIMAANGWDEFEYDDRLMQAIDQALM